MIKEIEYNRFAGRQGKCHQCCYESEHSCSEHECYPSERADHKNVYFVEVEE